MTQPYRTARRFSTQHGNIVAFVVAGVAAAAILATVAFTGYFQVTKGASALGHVAQTRSLLNQAAYTLATESSDVDGDGMAEAPAMTASGTAPALGGVIPSSSGAPKADAWGVAFGYCSWDNGTVNSSTSRITGAKPGTQSSAVFAVVSAGPNKKFDTTCAQASTGAAQSDDRLLVYNNAQIVQGVGGTVYFGDPVSDAAGLAALAPAGLKDGQVRLEKSSDTLYRWSSGSSKWTAIGAGTQSSPVNTSFRNVLINGNFDLWQRGTAKSVFGWVYLADRWLVGGSATNSLGGGGGNYTSSRIVIPFDASFQAPARYGLQIQRTAVGTLAGFGGDTEVLAQRIEDVRTLSGATVTASFYVQATTTLTFCADLMQYYGNGAGAGPGGVKLSSQIGRTCYTANTEWNLVTLTATLPNVDPSNIQGVGDSLWFRPVLEPAGTHATSFTVRVAQAQLEVGASRGGFEQRPVWLELELAQRYYETGSDWGIPGIGQGQTVVSYKSKKRLSFAPAFANFGGSAGCSAAVSSVGSNYSLDGFSATRTAKSTTDVCTFSDSWKVDAELSE